MKIGRIVVSKELLVECPALMTEYLSDFTIQNEEAPWDNPHVVIFTGTHDEFEHIRADEMPPIYDAVFDTQPDGTVKRRPFTLN